MKVEIGESLGYSFLRHVKKCWLVQTNWKASDDWPKHLKDSDLEQEFSDMRRKFAQYGSVFGKTTSSSQLLKQSEIDVVGVGFSGDIYAVEVAFHENGLQYGPKQETQKRVLKKMLRAKFLLDAYQLADGKQHIYFVSPKVHQGVKPGLDEVFAWLKKEYSEGVDWQLLTDDKFVSDLLVPTLNKAKGVADTSELFMRSVKLLELGGVFRLGDVVSSPHQETLSARQDPESETDLIQPLVQNLMQTLLDESSSLLTESDISNLMDRGYCQERLGLELGGFALLRRKEDGREISGHDRYWVKVYADRFYVTSQWWKDSHHRNAAALLSWVEGLIQQSSGQSAATALEKHQAAFRDYLGLSG